MGDFLFLVGAEVDAHLDFLTFDQSGQPLSVIGSIRIDGELRARIGAIVANESVEEFESTGLGQAESETTVTFVGSTMTFAETTDDFDTEFEYSITGIGTSELLTIRLEAEIEFEDGEVGQVTAHIRLRR